MHIFWVMLPTMQRRVTLYRLVELTRVASLDLSDKRTQVIEHSPNLLDLDSRFCFKGVCGEMFEFLVSLGLISGIGFFFWLPLAKTAKTVRPKMAATRITKLSKKKSYQHLSSNLTSTQRPVE